MSKKEKKGEPTFKEKFASLNPKQAVTVGQVCTLLGIENNYDPNPGVKVPFTEVDFAELTAKVDELVKKLAEANAAKEE